MDLLLEGAIQEGNLPAIAEGYRRWARRFPDAGYGWLFRDWVLVRPHRLEKAALFVSCLTNRLSNMREIKSTLESFNPALDDESFYHEILASFGIFVDGETFEEMKDDSSSKKGRQ
jgi:hypothetical protein